MMKKRILFYSIAAVSLMTVFSCSEIIEPQVTSIEQTAQLKTCTMSIAAGKGEVGTKALGFVNDELTATWTAGDKVDVYEDDTLLGTLTAKDVSTDGTSCTLYGNEITRPAWTRLTLKFLSPSYSTQDGTLTGNAGSIDKVCDYSTAEVTVNGTSGGNITINESYVSFTNQQAIVKFILRNSDNTASVSATLLKVNVDGTEISVSPASATDELYVAVPAVSGKSVSLLATTSSGDYGYTRSGVALEKGKYYEITVRMETVPEYANSAISIPPGGDLYWCVKRSEYKAITLDQAYAIAKYLAKTKGNNIAVVFNHRDTDLGPQIDYAVSTDKSAIRQSSDCYYPYNAGYQVYIVPASI